MGLGSLLNCFEFEAQLVRNRLGKRNIFLVNQVMIFSVVGDLGLSYILQCICKSTIKRQPCKDREIEYLFFIYTLK